MKRLLAFLLTLTLLTGVCAAAGADEELDELMKDFRIYHGSRQIPKVAVTVDDCNDLEYVWQIAELATGLGVHVTFFPIGTQIFPEDGENWRKVVDAGHEIGCHYWMHTCVGTDNAQMTCKNLGRFQQALDEALGYHYQVRWFRPPFGNIKDKIGRTNKTASKIKKYGYDHVLLWDVSQTNPEKAVKQAHNGSIMLYHARLRDFKCLQEVLPKLIEKGLQPVTVSELLETGPIVTSPDKYVYNQDDYSEKPKKKTDEE